MSESARAAGVLKAGADDTPCRLARAPVNYGALQL